MLIASVITKSIAHRFSAVPLGLLVLLCGPILGQEKPERFLGWRAAMTGIVWWSTSTRENWDWQSITMLPLQSKRLPVPLAFGSI